MFCHATVGFEDIYRSCIVNMKVVVVFIIVAPGLSFQHSDPCNDQVDVSREYDHHHPVYHHVNDQKHNHKKHSSRSKLSQSTELEISNKKYTQRLSRKRPSKKHTYDCICDCQRCEKLQQCCEPICNKECDQSESEQKNEVDTQPGLSSGNLVFVPYPYPMMVPPPAMPLPMPQFGNKTFSVGATEHYITSTAPSLARYGSYSFGRRQSDLQRDSVLDLLQSLRYRQEYPNVNLRPVKRSEMPDYGRISDQLLDRLIMQRNVKDITSR